MVVAGKAVALKRVRLRQEARVAVEITVLLVLLAQERLDKETMVVMVQPLVRRHLEGLVVVEPVGLAVTLLHLLLVLVAQVIPHLYQVLLPFTLAAGVVLLITELRLVEQVAVAMERTMLQLMPQMEEQI